MDRCIFLHLFIFLSVTGNLIAFSPDLPAEHLQLFYNQFPRLAPPADFKFTPDCWGFENNCRQPFSNPRCNGNFSGWAETQSQAERMFYSEADFGYVKDRRRELIEYCKEDKIKRSSLRCTKHLQFCEGRNIVLDFKRIKDKVGTENMRYKMDVLSPGDIKINCKIDLEKFSTELDYMSPLQSWAPELRNIRETTEKLDETDCDIVINKPLIVIKLDAYVNMYHHFCDFFNLYASLFVRPTQDGSTVFDTDNQVLIWENYRYDSNFAPAWKAFTSNPLMNLETVAGKRVCASKVTFPLLPRMMYGLYYNTPLIPGCQDSGLFRAFSQFMLHRLRIPLHEISDNKLRITLLLRKTKYRTVLNENQLIESLKEKYTVNIARFDHRTRFEHQLEVIRNSDILIGMHGAGLTHMLFLPDWAGVFELYNCNDPGCYSDLARLRGLYYMTWQNETLLSPEESNPHQPYSGPAHHKFRNYRFNVNEFRRIVDELAFKIKTDERYKNAIENIQGNRKSETKDEL